MKKLLWSSVGIGLVLAVCISSVVVTRAQLSQPPFPYCTDTGPECQQKIAQVPLPFQFWARDEAGNIMDRIRISPTWLNPPPGQPAGQGPVFVQRQVAVIPGNPGTPLELEDMVWDLEGNRPPVTDGGGELIEWRQVDSEPVEVVPGRDLEYVFGLQELEDLHARAVLVAYEVFDGEGETTGHFINQAVLGSPIVRVMVNLDVYNATGRDVTNFELDFLGLNFDCTAVLGAMGFVVGGGPWGANAGSPLVVRPISGGTEVKWVQADQPLHTSQWLHIGLVFSIPLEAAQATVQGYWTILGDCDPRTQGYWKRICDGAVGEKKLHPETPANFDSTLCAALRITGEDRSDPCIRAKAQFAALLLNLQYGYLAECCELEDGTTVGEAVPLIQSLISGGQCKEAADLAESINSSGEE